MFIHNVSKTNEHIPYHFNNSYQTKKSASGAFSVSHLEENCKDSCTEIIECVDDYLNVIYETAVHLNKDEAQIDVYNNDKDITDGSIVALEMTSNTSSLTLSSADTSSPLEWIDVCSNTELCVLFQLKLDSNAKVNNDHK